MNPNPDSVRAPYPCEQVTAGTSDLLHPDEAVLGWIDRPNELSWLPLSQITRYPRADAIEYKGNDLLDGFTIVLTYRAQIDGSGGVS